MDQPSTPPPGNARAAAAVLARNDRGARTVAAPDLYPHQWSWDAAFVAIGWAAVSVPRALDELRSLLRGQWSTGMLPHIVFSDAPGYFPGPQRWRTAGSAASPAGVETSGICQPPVHGLAVHVIGRLARASGGTDAAAFAAFAEETLDAWVAWHRWLDSARRDPGSGLVAIHHGWESGMDNSPRWDAAYAGLDVGAVAPYERLDLAHVADHGERPTDTEYDRYIWLVDHLAAIDHDDETAREVLGFRVGDVVVTALHALSAELLADLAADLGRTDLAAELRRTAGRARHAVLASCHPATGLARDLDLRAGSWGTAATIGGFAPLLCGAAPDVLDHLVATLLGPDWCGHPDLAVPVPPSTSPRDPAFDPASYWRGPTWPVVTWLLSWCLAHHGRSEAARRLRDAGSAQLADGRFAEYHHALDGRGLGSDHQSWTAAVALAWTVGEPRL